MNIADIFMLSSKLPSNKKMSASHEKSPTEKHTHKTAPHSSKSPLLSVIGVPVCATLACWQVSSMFQSKSEWSLQMDQIPANPKGDIWKGPKPKVNGSRRILEELPMLPPPLCNRPGGRFIEGIQLSEWRLSLSRFLKQCPRSRPSGYLPKMMTARNLLPLVGGPLASL